MNIRTVSEKVASLEEIAYVDRVGDDLLVLLSGGESHVGAVGIAVPGRVIAIPGKKGARPPSSPCLGTGRMQ